MQRADGIGRQRRPCRQIRKVTIRHGGRCADLERPSRLRQRHELHRASGRRIDASSKDPKLIVRNCGHRPAWQSGRVIREDRRHLGRAERDGRCRRCAKTCDLPTHRASRQAQQAEQAEHAQRIPHDWGNHSQKLSVCRVRQMRRGGKTTAVDVCAGLTVFFRSR